MKVALCAGAIAGLVFSARMSFAQTAWQENHPRRTEVNGRLENQNDRIQKGAANGSLSPGEAARLHRQDRRIRRQERFYASEHGGHITKAEQNKINREENHVSSHIYNEKHGN